MLKATKYNKETRSQITKRAKRYESIFENNCHAIGAGVIRIEDGARSVRTKFGQQIIRKKQPCDFIIVHNDIQLATDVKSTYKSSISYSQIGKHTDKKQSNKFIKAHQMSALNIFRRVGQAGIVLFYLNENQCIYYDIKVLNNLKPRKSLGPKDGFLLGNSSIIDLRPLFK